MNYKISLRYNGTNYHGWSIQPNNITIQEVIQNSIYSLFGVKDFVLNASGRTDAYVHAIDQVINLKHKNINLSSNDLYHALNSKLPNDIRINYVKEVDDKFHARYSAKNKTYVYLIETKPNYSVIHYNNVWQYNKPIDIKKIEIIKNKFVGTHNFLSFSTSQLQDTIRTINYINVQKMDTIIKIEINGDGFLRSMVRMIVGCFINYIEGKITINDIDNLFNNPKKGSSQLKVPGCGLYLYKVNY